VPPPLDVLDQRHRLTMISVHAVAVFGNEYRGAQGIADPIIPIDDFGGYWIKSG
jgi:hypothetical protein